MKEVYLLFVFVLLFTSSYSIRPKTDKKDFSKYFFNRSMIKGNIFLIKIKMITPVDISLFN